MCESARACMGVGVGVVSRMGERGDPVGGWTCQLHSSTHYTQELAGRLIN